MSNASSSLSRQHCAAFVRANGHNPKTKRKRRHHRKTTTRERYDGRKDTGKEEEETGVMRNDDDDDVSNAQRRISRFETSVGGSSGGALYCFGFPEFASAREEARGEEKIESIGPSLISDVSEVDAFRLASENPELTAVIALASLIIIPKAIEQIGKKIVLPLGAILIAYGVVSHPESAGTFVAGALGWAYEHPSAIAFVAVGLLALQLSPYIIIALLLALIFNISNIVPDEINPLLPKDVKENIREVKKDAQIAREALAPVERSIGELKTFKNEVQMQKERARKNRLEREEREKREEKEAREKPIKIAALKQKAAEEAKAKAKKAKPRFQSDENAIRNSSSNSSSRDDLGDITRCMSLPTPDARVNASTGTKRNIIKALQSSSRSIRINSS